MARNKFLLPLLKYNTLYAFPILTSPSPFPTPFPSQFPFHWCSSQNRQRQNEREKEREIATATAFRFDSIQIDFDSILARDKTQLMPASILCFLLILGAHRSDTPTCTHTHAQTHTRWSLVPTQAYRAGALLLLTVESCLLLSAKPALQCTWLLSAAVSSAWA